MQRDVNRDLFVRSRGRYVLFEIKTDANYGLYTAIGQLMLHGKASDTSASCFIVSPPIEAGVRRQLEALGIDVVEYAFDGKTIKFTGLAAACNACRGNQGEYDAGARRA